MFGAKSENKLDIVSLEKKVDFTLFPILKIQEIRFKKTSYNTRNIYLLNRE